MKRFIEGEDRFQSTLFPEYYGFAKRIMFGTDQVSWPQAIDVAVEGIRSAAFLSEEQKRDIFYNNSARFLQIR